MSLNRLSALVLILTPREISTATTEPTGLNRLSALVLILTLQATDRINAMEATKSQSPFGFGADSHLTIWTDIR